MCKHCYAILKTNAGANYSHPYHDPRCKLKEHNEQLKEEISAALNRIGHGGSMVNNNCPFFQTKNWGKCPYFEDVEQ